jgi:membrane protease YdiL (CAAX protease family)
MGIPKRFLDYASSPSRMDENERVGELWWLCLLGFLVWIFAQSFAASIAAPKTAATTQTALSPQQLAAASVVSAILVTTVLLIANKVVRKNGIKKLGILNFPHGLLLGLLASFVVLPIVFGATFLTQVFWDKLGYAHPNAHQVLRALLEASPNLQRVMFLSAIFLTPPAEELLFRGHLQTALLHTFSKSGNSVSARWGAILTTSIIFTIFHVELWMMPPIFVLSICLGYVYERSGNLWANIFIHVAFNAINVISFYWQMHH